jgi:TolB-like protein/Tfp pilus assembly protein PilF
VKLPDPDIFLSYNREDQAAARRFAEAFEAEGFVVWWDATLRSGEAYDQVTEEALRTAKAVVVLWSPRSVVSRWVRAEATLAERQKTLVPARIETCDLPIMFELTQTADLSHWQGDARDPAWTAFLADVRRRAGNGEAIPEKRAATPVAAIAEGGVPFVGVLPIAGRGDDEMELLAEDLTEDITRELSQDSFFEVIAASTMADWRGVKINHKQLGRELGASYFLEGKLQRLGEAVRVNFQLVDVVTGGMLRLARHSLSLAEFSSAPEEFAAVIASETSAAITQIEAKRAMEKPGPYSGWDHVMRALALMERLGSSTIPRAIEEANLAIAKVPELGLAHAMLARLINLNLTVDQRALGDAHMRSIQEHIARAMELDGNNPAILHFVVSAYVNLGDGDAGLRIARRALELNPNSPQSHFSLGQALHICGRYAEAIAAFREQMRLAPHDLNRPHGLLMLGVCLLLGDRPDEAAEALDRSLALQPSNGATLSIRAIAHALQGQEREARHAAVRIWNASDNYTGDVQIWIARQLFRERADEAEAILSRLWGTSGDDI